MDPDERRREIAERLGAERLAEVPERLDQVFPITVDSSASPPGLELALRATAADGTCTSTGIYFDSDDAPRFPLLEMYVRNTKFVTGRPHVRTVMPHALDAVTAGSFEPSVVTTRVVAWADAADALVEHDWNKLVFTRG